MKVKPNCLSHKLNTVKRFNNIKSTFWQLASDSAPLINQIIKLLNY